MTKQEIKNILMSIRTYDNEKIVNNMLGKIDMMDETSIQDFLKKIGNSKESIKHFFEEELSKQMNKQVDKFFPINNMFTYGIDGNTIHLHLPVDLHELLIKKGFKTTFDIVNLHLLDAIDKIQGLKNNGFFRFKDTNNIFMISPILVKREINFLEEMDFITHQYSKKDLNNDEFVKENAEAQLAISKFGKNNICSAKISFDTISSKEWQEKKKEKIEQFAKKGITLGDNLQVK